MRDQHINTFNQGMQKDLGNTVPQEGLYNNAENIRITSSGDGADSAIVVNVKGNKLKLALEYTATKTSTVMVGFSGYQTVTTTLGRFPCNIIGYALIRNTLVTFSIVDSQLISPTTGEVYNGTCVIHKIDLDSFRGTSRNYQVVYESPELNFKKEFPIEAVGRYESASKQKVYFTDNLNPIRVINIADVTTINIPVERLSLNPPVNFGAAKVIEVSSTGSLPAGMYQYTYRLKSETGKTTRFSPLSNFVHIVDGQSYWEYEPDPLDQKEYSNTTPGEETNKAVVIEITNIDRIYNEVEVAAVLKTNPNEISSAYIIDSFKVTSTSLQVTHVNDSGVRLLAEEITAISNTPTKAKTLAAKDNRLFMANLGFSIENLEFNARAYRYKRPDGHLYPIKSLEDTPGVSSVGITYADENFNPLTLSGSNAFSNEHNLDAVNPYNLELGSDVDPNNAYKFQKNGVTLGGQGPNISYRFIKSRIKGNTQNEIPGSPPFVSSSFKNETAFSTAEDNLGQYVTETFSSTGDFKSPIVATDSTGYRRNEVYRFGVVLYDLQGNPGFVNWIGDIKFPDYKDYDHEGGWNGGIYNYTLGQHPGVSDSGTNYHFDSDTINAYDNIHKRAEDEDFTTTHSDFYNGDRAWFDANKYKKYRQTSGDLYTLGIQFQIDLPESIKDKVSGYRVVRVERKEKDKTILGTGIVNFLESHESWGWQGENTAGGAVPNIGFGTCGNEKDSPSGDGLPYDDQYGFTKRTAMGYTFTWNSVRKGLPNAFSIDAPDWPFTGYPKYTSDMQVSVDGAVYGLRRHGYKSDASASVYPIHKLANEKEFLEHSFPVQNAFKLGRGERTIINTGDNMAGYELVNGVLVLSQQYSMIMKHHKAWAGVGEETFICIIEDQNPDGVENNAASVVVATKGLRTEEFVNKGRGRGARGKLLATLRRDLKGRQYGGNTHEKRAENTYIPAGPFISIENSKHINKKWGTHDVWGGDTYVVMYDIQKMKKHKTLEDYTLGTSSSGSTDHMPPESTSFAFPTESSVNTALRGGWHFANKEDWTDNTPTPWNTFDLNSVYSSENTTEVFIPKPVNLTTVSGYDNRILYSDVKINNAAQDAWTSFKVENYADLDGNKGPISKLINFKDTLYYLQSNGFGRLSVSPVSTVVDTSGTSIVLGTGDVIQDFQYLSNIAGNTDSRSIVASERGIYWADHNSKKLYSFNANGVQSISDSYGMKTWAFNTFNNETFDAYGHSKLQISSGVDPVNDEVLFSVGERTLVFNELLNRFTSFYTYSSNLHITSNDSLFSVDGNDIYEHNEGAYGEWYGNAGEVSIEFTVNKNPLHAKVFDHIEWYVQNTEGAELLPGNNFDNIRFRVSAPFFEQTSILSNEDSDFSLRENISRLPVPRHDDNSRMRDTYMRVTFTTNGGRKNDKIILHYVKTLFRISKR